MLTSGDFNPNTPSASPKTGLLIVVGWAAFVLLVCLIGWLLK